MVVVTCPQCSITLSRSLAERVWPSACSTSQYPHRRPEPSAVTWNGSDHDETRDAVPSSYRVRYHVVVSPAGS
jgi:hypothetical protein